MTVPYGATVLDSSVVSNFAHVERLDLLSDLHRVVTVPAVRAELEAGASTHTYLQAAVALLDDGILVVDLSDTVQERTAAFRTRVDPGEAQVLAVAADADGLVVTDDADARALAREHDIRLTGSIGVLLEAVATDRLSHETADRFLTRWIDEARFRAPARDLDAYTS